MAKDLKRFGREEELLAPSGINGSAMADLRMTIGGVIRTISGNIIGSW